LTPKGQKFNDAMTWVTDHQACEGAMLFAVTHVCRMPMWVFDCPLAVDGACAVVIGRSGLTYMSWLCIIEVELTTANARSHSPACLLLTGPHGKCARRPSHPLPKTQHHAPSSPGVRLVSCGSVVRIALDHDRLATPATPEQQPAAAATATASAAAAAAAAASAPRR